MNDENLTVTWRSLAAADSAIAIKATFMIKAIFIFFRSYYCIGKNQSKATVIGDCGMNK
jgi:hypothetical protein